MFKDDFSHSKNAKTAFLLLFMPLTKGNRMENCMKKQKSWVGIVTLSAVTACALFGGIALRKSYEPVQGAELSVEGYTELGIQKASKIVDEKGTITGYEVVTQTKGFAEEPIVLAVTFNQTADKITAVEVLSHKETEGFGSKIMEDSFLKQFINVELPVYLEGKKAQTNTPTPTKAPTPTTTLKPETDLNLQDGFYVERAKEPHNGYTSEVSLTVKDGIITEVVWEAYNEAGQKKSVLSQTGEYTMTPDGLLWADQAKALAAYVLEHQSVDGLTLNEEGKTDAVSGVSVSINEFVEQVSNCIKRAAQAKTVKPKLALKDGVYKVTSPEPENGYTSEVSITVEQGRITLVSWEQTDENGNKKSVLSESGQYVMTENGATWADQAREIATYVIEHQGISELKLDENGKTDALATVSISVNEFVSQVEECLKKADASNSSLLQDGVYIERAKEAENGYTSQLIMTVEDGVVTKIVWDSVDAQGIGKAKLSKEGRYVMKDNGMLWADQAQALAAYVLEHQGTQGLTVDENGKTDVITGVSISIQDFINQTEACLTRASAAKIAAPNVTLSDGNYTVTAQEADNSGYKSQVTLTVLNGRIQSVVWDCIDAEGNTKRMLSENGQYVMTENGATWAEQANALATYVIEKQGISGLTTDENGKTDVVATVSIGISDFINQVEECLKQAAGGSGVAIEPTQEPQATPLPEKQEPQVTPLPEKQEPQEGTRVDGITGASYSSRGFVEGINHAYEYILAILEKES